jgi:hypothetical protein
VLRPCAPAKVPQAHSPPDTLLLLLHTHHLHALLHGHPSPPPQDHAIALGHFKAAIAKAGLHIPPALLVNGDLDATLLRFLRARKWSIEAALAMLESECGWSSRVCGACGVWTRDACDARPATRLGRSWQQQRCAERRGR